MQCAGVHIERLRSPAYAQVCAALDAFGGKARVWHAVQGVVCAAWGSPSSAAACRLLCCPQDASPHGGAMHGGSARVRRRTGYTPHVGGGLGPAPGGGPFGPSARDQSQLGPA